MPKMVQVEFNIEVQPLGETASPLVIAQSEYVRCIKDMGESQAGMALYGSMPNVYTLVLNNDRQLIQDVLTKSDKTTEAELKSILSKIKDREARLAILHQSQGKKKSEEVTQEEKDGLQNTEKALKEQKEKKTAVIVKTAKDNQVVHQLVNFGLLQNGMLKGASLDAFLRRNVDLTK